MPIYEYRCTKGHKFEVMQRMTDDPVTVCEVCSKPVERVFHPVAVHFKGKGFYNTDYGTKRRNRELAAAGEGKDSSSSGTSESASSESKDSKPAKDAPAKTDSKPADSKASKPKAEGKSPKKAA